MAVTGHRGAAVLMFVLMVQCVLESNGERRRCDDSAACQSRRRPPPAQCRNLDARLRNMRETASGIEGSVEICKNGLWQRLCALNESMVTPLCNQLHYTNGRVLRTEVPPGGPLQLVELELNCPPMAPDLRRCTLVDNIEICFNLDGSPVEQIIVECFNDFVPFLATNYYNTTVMPRTRSGGGAIENIDTTAPIPFGNETFGSISVHANGVVAFGGRLGPQSPQFPAENNRAVLAPFWVEPTGLDAESTVEIFNTNRTGTDPSYVQLISNFVTSKSNTAFNGSLLILIRWNYPNAETPYSLQAIIITDYNRTYTIYSYECLQNPPVISALIGTSGPTGINQFRYSNLEVTSRIGCANNIGGGDIDFYTLMYSLDQVQTPVSNGTGTSIGTGTCQSAGLVQQTCCRRFMDPTESCRVTSSGGGVCYCDGLCFERNDCCSDVHSIPNITSCVDTCSTMDRPIMFVNDMSNGYPRICRNGLWQYVCNRDMSWGASQANSVCQIDNFGSGEIRMVPPLPSGRLYPAGISNVVCNGLENNFLDCQSTAVPTNRCMPMEFATATCLGMAACRNGNVRLSPTGSHSQSDGVVEICVEGRWRMICHTDWDEMDASVICRQLSMNETALSFTSDFGGSVTARVNNVMCLGTEERLNQCPLSVGDVQCLSVAGVNCGGSLLPYPSSSPPSSPPSSSPTQPDLGRTVNVPLVGIIVPSSIATLIVVGVPVVAIFVVVRMRRKRKSSMEYLEEMKDRKQFDSQHGNEYVKSKLFQGSKRQTANIKSQYLPLISSNLVILNEQLRLLDSLGQGEFGVVYKAHLLGFSEHDDITTVAVKTLKGTYAEDDVDGLVKEFLQMKQLQHPNVMGLIGVCLDAGPAPYIVLPFMANGNLLSYLKQRRSTLLLSKTADEDEISTVQNKLLSMCLQITKGMEYLASKKFVHRDLAARNCMIDEAGIIKVADFGLTKSTYDKLYFRQDMGDAVKLPIKWIAIESIEDGVFSEKSDVWAFGVTCWEIFSGGKMPYGGLTPLSLPKLLRDGERMEIPDNAACSDEIYKMVMFQCWYADPDDRPTFSQLQTEISTALTTMAGYMEFSEFASVDSIGDNDTKTAETSGEKKE